MKATRAAATHIQYANRNIRSHKPETMKIRTEAMKNQKHHSAEYTPSSSREHLGKGAGNVFVSLFVVHFSESLVTHCVHVYNKSEN